MFNNRNKKDISGRILRLASVVVAAIHVFSFSAVALAVGGIEAYAGDTIAGYSALLRTSRTNSDKDIVFTVQKPNGVKITIPAKTDDNGVAMADLLDFHTKRAGIYYVSAAEEGGNGDYSAFTVYPDDVSAQKSVVVPNKQMAEADGEDRIVISVQLKDAYGNPIPRHSVALLSSRSEDSINVSSSNTTDDDGVVNFLTTSRESGVSTFTAYDKTDNKSLDQRVKVVFYKPGAQMENVGGDGKLIAFVPTAYAQSISGGPVASFMFDDIKSEIGVNENATFTLKAVDSSENVSENYAGKVHFSVEGAAASDVSLPDDYQFNAEDLGAHTFSLGLSFKAAGTYKIVATDLTSTDVKGDITVNVVSGGDSTAKTTGSTSVSNSGQPKIDAPRPGTYNQGIQTVTGTATPGIALKIYDNDKEIGGADADSEGGFTFKTQQLLDGEHKLKVVVVNDSGEAVSTSDVVTINIDTTAPDVDELRFDPAGPVGPESLVKVTLITDKGLAQTAIVVNEDFAVLSEDLSNPGNYRGSFLAPKEVGTYGVDLILVDSLGNEAQLKNQKQLVVADSAPVNGDSGLDAGSEGDQLGDSAKPAAGETVGAVTEVKAFSGDGKVTLQWNEVEGAQKYRVYYGVRADSLVNAVDTYEGLTRWYVPNLDNGTEYFFALAAIDAEGNESAVKSEIVSGIPFVPDAAGVVTDSGQDKLFSFDSAGAADVTSASPSEMHEAAKESPGLDKTGPEMVWAFGLSLLAGWFYLGRRKKQRLN